MPEETESTTIDEKGPDGAIDISPTSTNLSSAVITYDVTLAQIAKLKDKYSDIPTDLAVKENYKLVKDGASLLRGLRTKVEKRRKELKADALEYGKKVDGAAKELTEKLLEIEEPIATAKKDFDTAVEVAKREAALAEEKRIDGIADRIAKIKAFVGADISADSSVIKEHLSVIQKEQSTIDEWADEFTDKAKEATTQTWDKLSELFTMKLQQEQAAEKQAEAEAQRIHEEEEARKKREIEIAAERARMEEVRAKMETERAKMEEERIRLAREADELAAKFKAEQDEKDAINKALIAKAERLQEIKNAELEAYEEQAKIDQAKKDAAAEQERLNMLAEIEKLKKDQEASNEISSNGSEQKESGKENNEAGSSDVREVSDNEVHPLAEAASANGEGSLKINIKESDYKAAGAAMKQIIGNFAITKTLLDSIIAGEIPFVQFMFEVAE